MSEQERERQMADGKNLAREILGDLQLSRDEWEYGWSFVDDLINLPGPDLTPTEVQEILEEIRIAREEWD
ncbi:MAG: hypothetical protein ACXVOI_06440 [Tumebacillaceae bacterium]